MTPGQYGVVLICHCTDGHPTKYIARSVSRRDAVRLAIGFTSTNGHDCMVVLHNGLEEPTLPQLAIFETRP